MCVKCVSVWVCIASHAHAVRVCDRISASEQSSVKNLTKRKMSKLLRWVTGFHFPG